MELKNSPVFSLLFDESLNRVLQQKQMYAQVRYWSSEKQQAVTRYLTSAFFHRPNADNIVAAIADVVKDLEESKMSQLGMDGPKTNLLVLQIIQGHRKEAEHPPLEDLGSCGLHVVAGALKFALLCTPWNLKKED